DVQRVAASIGIDLNRVTSSVDTLSGRELQQAAIDGAADQSVAGWRRLKHFDHHHHHPAAHSYRLDPRAEMIGTLLFALSLTSGLSTLSTQGAVTTVEVPYLSQTDLLCGGAAAAMVFRYWGDFHADVQQFASLVDMRAGGIASDTLVQAVESRGWRADHFEGSLAGLHGHLAAGQPVI